MKIEINILCDYCRAKLDFKIGRNDFNDPIYFIIPCKKCLKDRAGERWVLNKK